MANIIVTEEMYRQFTTQLNQILSAVEVTAIGKRRLKPHAEYVTGPDSVTIPADTKAFNIINLGMQAGNRVFNTIMVTGITGITEILPPIRVFGYTIENDLDVLQGEVIVTPAENHVILVQYLLPWHLS